MARNAGSDAWISSAIPKLVATVQTACPMATPAAVATPQRRPPAKALRTVRAVSGPGVQITITETPTKATSWASWLAAPSVVAAGGRHHRHGGADLLAAVHHVVADVVLRGQVAVLLDHQPQRKPSTMSARSTRALLYPPHSFASGVPRTP